jgi:hypothetical protein
MNPPNLRPARLEDYPAIQRLIAEHRLEATPPEDWSRLWLNNPLWPRLADRWPVGWVLEDDAGRVVGTLSNVPTRYRLGGRELICANGRFWVVAADYRGYALWLMDEYFNQPGVDLFINTTVQTLAAGAFAVLSARVPAGDWMTAAYFVTGYRDFGRRALEKLRLPDISLLSLPAAAAAWLRDALFAPHIPAAPTGYEVAATDGFDGRFDAFWEELLAHKPTTLLAARDARTLAWHYAGPLRRGRLWVYTASRGGQLRAYCVVKRQDFGQGLRRLRVTDYQTLEPGVDLLPGLLRPILRRASAEGYAVLEHFGCGLPKMAGFDRLAPYRRRTDCWEYYYKAADPALEVTLASADAWDPSVYDGDASFD